MAINMHGTGSNQKVDFVDYPLVQILAFFTNLQDTVGINKIKMQSYFKRSC